MNERDKLLGLLKKDANIEVTQMRELLVAKRLPEPVISVLLDSLSWITDPGLLQEVLRSLTLKQCKGKVDLPLMTLFESLGPTTSYNASLKWAVGNALSLTASRSIEERLVTAVKDREMHGKAREMLVLALANMPGEKAGEVLLELLLRDDLVGHAAMAAKSMKMAQAIPLLKKHLSHPVPWVRKKVNSAVKSIEEQA